MTGTRAPEGGTRCLRNVLGRFATGVVAVASQDPVTGVRSGLAANSFCSVSLDPPLVSFCVAETSTSWPRIRVAAGCWASASWVSVTARPRPGSR